MLRVNKRWLVATRLSKEADSTLSEYPPIIRQILFNREYKTAEAAREFLEARIPAGTDPFGLSGIAEAVDRLEWAIAHHQPVAIYGDYDADGVTATALLVEVLAALGGEVRGYIPNRFDEGYGLNNEALDNLSAQGVKLVVTVDCGIRSPEEAQHSRTLGLDLIITDHHQPGGELPEALSVINPKKPGDTYPEKDLAGVGLAYKLAEALIKKVGQARISPESYLDLVALGTVADLAPLRGENRAMVRAGLEYLRRPHRQGIQSLIGVAGLQPQQLTASDIGFVLGPRINAAGRLESALAALELLTCTSPEKAGLLAQQLDVQNRDRQRIMQEIQVKAEQIALAGNQETLLLFACDESFNPGVVGLAASRLTDSYYRPTIVAYRGEQFTRASCRSIPEFHITEALDQCAGLLEHHGGHAAAAGFTVRNENLPALLEQLQGIVAVQLAHLDLRPLIKADVEVHLSDLKPELLQYLDRFQPTGYGNPQAYFVSRDLMVKNSRTVGRENNHLKLAVTDGWITYDAIAFNLGYWQENLPPKVDLLYNFERNEFNGRITLQLKVRDLKPAGSIE